MSTECRSPIMPAGTRQVWACPAADHVQGWVAEGCPESVWCPVLVIEDPSRATPAYLPVMVSTLLVKGQPSALVEQASTLVGQGTRLCPFVPCCSPSLGSGSPQATTRAAHHCILSTHTTHWRPAPQARREEGCPILACLKDQQLTWLPEPPPGSPTLCLAAIPSRPWPRHRQDLFHAPGTLT